MIITFKKFHDVLARARAADEVWPALNQVEWSWNAFCFDDDGVYYLSPSQRRMFRAVESLDRKLSELDWGAEWKSNPGYCEPEGGWVIH